MADPQPGNVPFDEAIDFLRQKVRLPTNSWTDIWEGAHARAFVIAGATQDALIADFHNAVTDALANGTTLATFRKDFDRIVAAHGWSYNGGAGWRSKVIYNTNLRMARAAGQWKQIQRQIEARPYLRYSAVMDSRTRPEHAAWHGTVLRADDPWWRSHYPPNDWGCRCAVEQWSTRDLDRHGFEVSKAAPEIQMEARSVNTPGGPVTVQVPQGIGTGFGYNVGEAAFGRGQSFLTMESHGKFEDLMAPGGNRPRQVEPLIAMAPQAEIGPRVQIDDIDLSKPEDVALVQDRLGAVMNNVLGADEKILRDPVGGHVLIGKAIIDHMAEKQGRLDGREAFFPLIPELIEDPQEIWIGFAASAASGRVLMRRRYVKLFSIGKQRGLALVADADNGAWSGLTFFRGDQRYLATLRTGLRIHGENKE
ncbi:MAG: phage minor head protein [Alphaproteobacteria bacterium]